MTKYLIKFTNNENILKIQNSSRGEIMGIRKEFLIILMILFFVSLASVAASDGNNTLDDHALAQSNDDTTVSVENHTDDIIKSDELSSDAKMSGEEISSDDGALKESDDGVLLAASGDEEVLGDTIYGPSGAYFRDLADTIENNGGNTIILDHTYNNNAGTNRPYGIAVHDGTTIIGQSSSGRVTLDRNSASARLFAVDEWATVTFKNLNMINGHRHDSANSKYGGVVHIGTNSDVTLFTHAPTLKLH